MKNTPAEAGVFFMVERIESDWNLIYTELTRWKQLPVVLLENRLVSS